MPRLPPALRWALRAVVTLGVAAWIVTDVDMGDVGAALRAVRPAALAAALGLYLGGQLLSAWKWALLGRAVGLDQPTRAYARFYFIGMFFNLLGPSTVGGDVARGLYLGEGRPALALNSVVFDRLSGLAFLMALGAAALLLGPRWDLPWPLVATVVGGGVALVVGWWTCPRLVRLLPAGNRVRRVVEHDLAPFWHARGLLVRVAALSLVFHLSQVGVQYLVARAAGTVVPLSYCLVYHPVISIMAALPVSIAGLGVREGGYLYFLTRAGYDDSIAVTIGLLWFAVTVLAGLAGGAVFLASGAALPPVTAPRSERAAATS